MCDTQNKRRRGAPALLRNGVASFTGSPSSEHTPTIACFIPYKPYNPDNTEEYNEEESKIFTVTAAAGAKTDIVTERRASHLGDAEHFFTVTILQDTIRQCVLDKINHVCPLVTHSAEVCVFARRSTSEHAPHERALATRRCPREQLRLARKQTNNVDFGPA